MQNIIFLSRGEDIQRMENGSMKVRERSRNGEAQCGQKGLTIIVKKSLPSFVRLHRRPLPTLPAVIAPICSASIHSGNFLQSSLAPLNISPAATSSRIMQQKIAVDETCEQFRYDIRTAYVACPRLAFLPPTLVVFPLFSSF